MHIATDVAGHIGNLLSVEIIRRVEVKSPVFGRLDITVKTQGIGQSVIVFTFFPIKCAITQREAITEREAPRNITNQITIGIVFARIFFLA